MSQTRPKKQITPLNADSFNLIPDWAATADTSGVVVSVANQTEGDTIAAALSAAGYPVTDARPLYCWDLSQNAIIVKGTSGWRGGIRPFGHMGRTDGFQGITGVGTVVQMSAAQQLRGGVTFDNANDSLVLPISGQYRITLHTYHTGGTGYWAIGKAQCNLADISGTAVSQWKQQESDYMQVATVAKQFNAGDKINVIMGGNSSTWGTDGYNGAWVEVEYMDQW